MLGTVVVKLKSFRFAHFISKVKMSAKERLAVTRAIQRVSNAIANPTTNERTWEAAWEGVRGLRLYSEDFVEWFRFSLKHKRYEMLATIAQDKLVPFSKSTTAATFKILVTNICNGSSLSNTLLRLLLSVRPIDCVMQHVLTQHAFEPALDWVFELEGAAPAIVTICSMYGYRKTQRYFKINKALKRQRAQRWRLLRFWLLVKRLVPIWRETLYEPGTGAIYKKAEARFSESLD
jgi:hypothetical protein